MKLKKSQLGFTLTELLVVVFGIAWVVGMGSAIYIGIHFINKFW